MGTFRSCQNLLNICLFSLYQFKCPLNSLSPELASVSSELGEKPRGLGMKSSGWRNREGSAQNRESKGAPLPHRHRWSVRWDDD